MSRNMLITRGPMSWHREKLKLFSVAAGVCTYNGRTVPRLNWFLRRLTYFSAKAWKAGVYFDAATVARLMP